MPSNDLEIVSDDEPHKSSWKENYDEKPLFLDSQVRGAAGASSLLPSPTKNKKYAIDQEHALQKRDQEEKESVSDWRISLQEQLYQRPQQQQELLHAYQRQTSLYNKQRCLLLISGPGGSGRTRLAKKTLKPIVEQQEGGYFISGKFDQLQHATPYSALVDAFTEFTNHLEQKNDLETLRTALQQALGNDILVLVRMIPALERLIGGTTTPEEAAVSSFRPKTEEAVQRFVIVFRKFIRAICGSVSRLVLFLDDLHWADPCSMDIIASLVADSDQSGLIVVATCAQDTSSRSYLATMLRELEDGSNAYIAHVRLGNLSQTEISERVAVALGLTPTRAEELAEILFRVTKGNLVNTIEFIRWLEDYELLYYDDDTWNWDQEEIDMTINKREVVDFLVDKIQQLPADVIEVLKVASCLGIRIDGHLIEYAVGHSVSDALATAAAHGVLMEDETKGKYMFEHDGVQRAAYSLIPPGQPRELYHLEIGRRMWRNMKQEEVDRHIFTLLSQMNHGRNLITRNKEKKAVCTLCLQAGMLAARSSTFRMALVYLELGLALLTEVSWREDYELTLTLHNSAAETAVITTNFERSNELVCEVLRHARTLQDKIPAYCTRIYALGMGEKPLEGMAVGVDVLRQLGEPIPKHLTTMHLIAEFARVKKLLKGKSDEQLLRLPLMDNKDNKRSCLQIMHLILLNSLFRDPQLTAMAVLKMTRITLTHGLSVFASTTFAAYAMLCVGATRRLKTSAIDEAIRFGKLGLKLLDRFDAKEFLPRVFAFYYGLVFPLKFPITQCLNPLLDGYKVGMQTGDIETACLCANLYCMNSIDAGIPLDTVRREWMSIQGMMLSKRMRSLLNMTVPAFQNVELYMGITRDPAEQRGTLYDPVYAFQIAKDNGEVVIAVALKYTRMMLSFVFRDLDTAEEMAKALKMINDVPPCFAKINILFFGGMVLIECVRQNRNPRRNLWAAKKIVKEFRRYAAIAPNNCLDKRFLLQAELFSVTGQLDRSYEKYIASVALAKASGFIFMIALANECLARHLIKLGEIDTARPFFNDSIHFYREWKAQAKVELLEAEAQELFASSST